MTQDEATRLLELARSVEADEADRQTEAQIDAMVRPGIFAGRSEVDWYGNRRGVNRADLIYLREIGVRHYTTSLDDAMSLRPKGWTIANLGEGDDGTWWCEMREGYLTSYGAVAISHLKCATPVLALTAAALRARAATLNAARDQEGQS